MKPLEALAFIGLGAIWGSSFLFIKWSATYFPPITLVAMRLLLASCIMFVFNAITAIVKPSHREIIKLHLCSKPGFLWRVLMMGFLNNTVPFTLVAWAETKNSVNVGIASVLDSAIPLFGQLFGHFLLPGEKVTFKRGIGLIVGFGGVFTVCIQKMVGGDNSDEQDTCDACVYGYYAMIIVATAAYAIASVWGKRMLSDYNPLITASGQIFSGCLINVILALAWEYNDPVDNFAGQTHFSFLGDADYKAWIGIAYLGAISTCVAYSLYFYLLATIGSVRQTMVGFLLPIFGVFEGAMFNGDWSGVSWLYIFLECLGAVLIGAGIWFVNFADKKKPTSGDEAPLLSDSPTNEGYNSINNGKSNFFNDKIVNGPPTSTPRGALNSMNNVQSYA